MKNIQTGNSIYITNFNEGVLIYQEFLGDSRFLVVVYTESETTFTYSDKEDGEVHFDTLGDTACLDDALSLIESVLPEGLRGWHCPQSLGL
jgi:hypothetical protein